MGSSRAVPQADLDAAFAAVEATKSKDHPKGNLSAAAKTLRLARGTLQARLTAHSLGHSAEAKSAGKPTRGDYVRELADLLRQRPEISEKQYRKLAKLIEPHQYTNSGGWGKFKAEAVALLETGYPGTDLSKRESLRVMLKKAYTLDEIAGKLSVDRDTATLMVQELRDRGVLVQQFGEHYQIHAAAPSTVITTKHIHTSESNGYYKFGYISDNHYGSKYCRTDVNDDLYDWFAAEGVRTVYNTGNYIDGEARFNKHDITVHGMQNQVDYFCKHYPQRPGIVTKFISGDDHEGWYGQREGIDIGWLTQKTAEDKFKRFDLIHLGFIEAFVRLQHAEIEKASTTMLLVHPGGGSSYALSYAPQKYVEALQGGEKPAVILFGHWHKIFDLLIRNIICLGGGCTKDLDTFGRKMKLNYHIGGMIVELWQDDKGAITRYRVEKKQYFDRGYYNDNWSYTANPTKVAA